MNGIQVLLLIGIGLLSLVFVSKTRSKGFNIVILVMAAAISAIFVLWPDFTTKIARLLGVGRGTDFVLYISIMLFTYIVIQLFARIRKLEQMMTELIRQNAVQSASSLTLNEPDDAV